MHINKLDHYETKDVLSKDKRIIAYYSYCHYLNTDTLPNKQSIAKQTTHCQTNDAIRCNNWSLEVIVCQGQCCNYFIVRGSLMKIVEADF